MTREKESCFLKRHFNTFDSRCRSVIGDTRRALGDAAGAEAAYRRCLEINPDYGRAIHGLERLKKTPVQ